MPRPLSERFERSVGGRTLLGLLVLLLVGLEVATHLPPSPLQRAVADPARTAVRVLGVEHAWGVFAPDPRATSLRLEARVTFADGTTTSWTIPDGPRVIANLRYYRWRKWLERVRSDRFRSIWRPTAEWVASLHADGPSPVVRVELVRHHRTNAIAGEQPPWEETTYVTLDLQGDGR